MALVHVIKWEANTHELVHKFPVEDLRLGSQLVVYPGQTAFFVKGGNTFDEFTAGTYIIKTENIPLLNKVYNLPSVVTLLFKLRYGLLIRFLCSIVNGVLLRLSI